MPVMKMTKEYVLDIGHIDGRGLARPSAIVEFMQDLATCHAAEIGVSGEAVAEKHAFWVLSRLKYQLDRPLLPYETIQLTTMPREIRGASWYRDFTIADASGEIGHAVTAWAVVNLETRHLIRPNELGIQLEKQETGQTELLRSIRSRQLEPCFDRVVRYSDIDINRHLNNVKAVDILSDAFDLEHEENRWVSQLQVNYITENVCGTTLNLRRGPGKEGSLCVSAFHGDKETVQAEVVFSTR